MWHPKAKDSMEHVDLVRCGISQGFSMITNGIEDKNYRFAGLSGYAHFYNQANYTIVNLAYRPNIDTIETVANAPIKAKWDVVKPAVETFVDLNSPLVVLDPVDRTTNLKPMSLSGMTN